MKIETKFNLDDTVYYLYNGKITECKIQDIRIKINHNPDIQYNIEQVKILKQFRDVSEIYLFSSPEELSKALLKKFEEQS